MRRDHAFSRALVVRSRRRAYGIDMSTCGFSTCLIVQFSCNFVPQRRSALEECGIAPLASSGMPSLEACKHHLDTESGLRYEDHMYEFVFSCKNTSVVKGEEIRQLIDVYVVSLKRPPELHKIYYDIKEATELKYVGIGELEQAYQNQDPNFVLVNTPEYARRLFHFLHKKIRVYLEMLPKIDSDEERHNKKGEQLLDRIGDVNKLRRAEDLGVIVEPCKRIDAYSESVWHRAVHVWVFDVESSRVLLLQRSPKKRHFGGRWNCSTGHIKMGDPALPTALKSVKDDVGLGNVQESDLEYLFQTLVEMDTGGDAFLKQVVDVYVLPVPNEATYPEVPELKSFSLAKGEVDNVMYLELDRLQEVYHMTPPPNDFVVFPGEDYRTRFFFNLGQRSGRADHILDGSGDIRNWPGTRSTSKKDLKYRGNLNISDNSKRS
eukprot:symbB.v1.2.017525.t1/scaffold1370.1/size122994/16